MGKALGINNAGRKLAAKILPVDSSGTALNSQRLSDDETAIQVLRAGNSISLAFLIIYLIYHFWSGQSRTWAGTVFHSITVFGAIAFLAGTWTEGFRRHWKFWNLVFCIGLITVFILISAQTREGDSRFVVVLLFPIATASFVNWGWQWQVAMGLSCLVLYGLAELLVPLSGGSVHRWLGLLAAVVLAECTSFFMGQYRKRLDAQVDQLVRAAAFRESQIATMAHDIRSPVASIAGFVDLLEDEDLSDDDRRDIMARIGSTAWSMDLTVSNVLDFFQIAGGQLGATPMRLDPNRIVAEAAASCAAQAVHKGLKLEVSYGEVPRGNFDPHHLERIARNLLAYSIGRLSEGGIRLRTSAANHGITIEVEDDGPAPSDEEIEGLLKRVDTNGDSPNKAMLGLHVARALAESAGGRLKITMPADNKIKLVAEIPSAKVEQKPPAT